MGVEVAVVVHAANHLTARQAQAVLAGISRVEGVRAQLLNVDDLAEGAYEWTALDRADAIVFGAPTYLGSVPAGFQRFREASARRRWQHKLATGFTTPGSSGEDPNKGLRQLERIAQEHGMVWVEPKPAAESAEPELLGQCVAEAALRSKRS